MELTITLPEDADRVALLGTAERNLKLIREMLGVSISARDSAVRLSGEGAAVNRAAEVLADLTEAARANRPMSRPDVINRLHSAVAAGESPGAEAHFSGGGNGSAGSGVAGSGGRTKGEGLEVYVRGRRVEPKTPGQQSYLKAIREHDLVFCCGPAGTGKTFLAVASAVAMLKQGLTRKLVLVRPAVEAGEKLGFLPGDMQQKVNPYLRPLLDALHDMMPFEQVQRFMHSDLIEVVPLAFMRGRTLNEAAIIMDEAQNTTRSQMLMFLTRLGHGSKMIVTGDTSQTDLEDGQESGLVDAVRRLRRVPGVAFQTLTRQDIVRHQLVHEIVQAYGQEPGQDAPQATD